MSKGNKQKNIINNNIFNIVGIILIGLFILILLLKAKIINIDSLDPVLNKLPPEISNKVKIIDESIKNASNQDKQKEAIIKAEKDSNEIQKKLSIQDKLKLKEEQIKNTENITKGGSSILDKLKKDSSNAGSSIMDRLKGNDKKEGKVKKKQEQNNTIKSFNQATRLLPKIYTGDNRKELYCGCKYNTNKTIIKSSCGYSYNKYKKRSSKIEWEHVVPAQNFGQSFLEWRKPHEFEKCKKSKGGYYTGRTCAGKNKTFAKMEGDLYNLIPAMGSLNATRSNYQIANISGEKRRFGSCDFEVESRKVEPPENIKGDIARIYLYMQEAYPQTSIIGNRNKKIIDEWDKMDPVDEYECNIYKIKKQYQKNINNILEERCN